jgi:hypothetical protein
VLLTISSAVVGDVNGQFITVFEKLGNLHAKSNFDLAIVVGNLFAGPDSTTNEDVQHVSSLIEGKIKIPLPTYFAQGNHPFPDKVKFKLEEAVGELCPNLTFLGRKTTTKTAEGLKIVSLGGRIGEDEDASSVKDPYSSVYTEAEAKSLKGANHADILITSEWPENINKGSKIDVPSSSKPAWVSCVSELDLALKPKYHFSVSPLTYYEREPFFHLMEEKTDPFKITRFISLAEFGNKAKQKWIYAFSIDTTATDPLSLPQGTTTSPLVVKTNKRSGAPTDQTSFRFSSDTTYQSSRPNKRRKRQPPPGPSECFFCLSNPNVATQLITSIGNNCYLTTAKGPLPTNTTFKDLECPAHILIIPLAHAPTLASITEEESRASTIQEMNLFRTALNNMLKSRSKGLGSVTMQVNRESGIHCHWQWLPIPISLIEKALVTAAFKVEAENEKYPKFETKKTMALEDAESENFQATIWNPATDTESTLYLPLDPSFRFDYQFGRRVLAKLLGLDSRADWHDCGQSAEEEEKDVKVFKEAFKEYDFSLEE